MKPTCRGHDNPSRSPKAVTHVPGLWRLSGSGGEWQLMVICLKRRRASRGRSPPRALLSGGNRAGLPRAFDRLDVVYAAAVPIRAEPGTTRRGNVLKQVRQRTIGTMRRDQFVAIEGRLPVALGAANEFDLPRSTRAPATGYPSTREVGSARACLLRARGPVHRHARDRPSD